MGKHLDAVKSLDEFRAPWETESGTDAEIDRPKLKRFLHNLVTDKAKAQDAREDALESVKTLEAELETAKAEVAKASPEESNKKIEKLEKDLAEAKANVKALESEKEISALRAEALKDIDPKYHEWIKGDTEDELEASIEKFKETFGLVDPDEADDEDAEDETPEVRTRPRSRITNPADPLNGKPGEAEIDFDKVADSILGSSPFG